MIILAFAEESIQLVPDGTILIHLVMVVVMVALLNRTLFRPINKILADREAQTTGRADETRRLRGDIDRDLSRYERDLREARTSGYHLIERERGQALKLREQNLSQVRDEIRAEVDREKREIERQAAGARETLRAQAIESAREIGSQILHRPVK